MSINKVPIQPRGIRNNNPGNIMFNPNIVWIGQKGCDPDGYVIFNTSVYGLRAMARLLTHYYLIDGLVTTQAIISKWAPPESNPTHDYVAFVSHRVGLLPQSKLNKEKDAIPFMRAMVLFENGECPYTDIEFETAIHESHHFM